MTTLFVTRHPGAVEWAARMGVDAEMVSHLDLDAVRAGDVVIGTLPVHMVAQLCAKGARYLHLSMELPEEARRRELSADDMQRYGARLEEFEARRVGG